MKQNDAFVFFKSLIYFICSKKVKSPFWESIKFDIFFTFFFKNFSFLQKDVFFIIKFISNGPWLVNKDFIF